MEELRTIKTYQEFKAATDREVYNQAEGFVRLGYLLRRAEDTDILSESGYKTVTEFAKAEYGLTETYVSRYININKRYSEGGYSERLIDRFQGFDLAKLADMLTLPDEVVEVIPAAATRAEIQEIKREVAREQQVSDLEVLMESKAEAEEEDILTGMLKEYYHDAGKLEEYQEMHAALQESDREKRKRTLFDALAPSGDAVKLARVPGVGRLMLTIRGMDQYPELLNVRSGDKRSYTWEELQGCLETLFGLFQDPVKDWEAVYQEKYPDAREPAKDKRKAGVVGIARAVPAQPTLSTPPKEEPEEKKEFTDGPEKQPEEQEIHKIAPVQEEREESVTEPEEVEPAGVENSPVHEDSKKLLETVSDEKKRERSQAEKKAERDSARQQAIEHLKREALEETEEIRRALEKGYYNMAHMGAKKLLTILEAVRKELDRKEVPGQMDIKEFIEKEDKGVMENEEDHMENARR